MCSAIKVRPLYLLGGHLARSPKPQWGGMSIAIPKFHTQSPGGVIYVINGARLPILSPCCGGIKGGMKGPLTSCFALSFYMRLKYISRFENVQG